MNAITTSDKPLNVGLIGYGLGGATFHAPFIAITPGLHLSAVMTSDPARRAAVAERYPDARLASDLNELLAGTPRLDLIAISSRRRSPHRSSSSRSPFFPQSLIMALS